MVSLDASLVAVCGGFIGQYAPFQSIHIQPSSSGVLVMASDHGRITVIGHDARGRGDAAATIVPSSELLKACAALKTAKREVLIEGDTATVITYRKTTADERRVIPVINASTPFPPIGPALVASIERWGATPQLSATAGRYETAFLEKAIKTVGVCAPSLVLSCFDGGPLRLQSETIDICVLVMPQAAEPIPAVPTWIQEFAASSNCQSGHLG